MVFYFSGTGNSRYAAHYIAKHLEDRTVDIADALKKDVTSFPLEPGEAVGFVLPTYFFGIPVIMHSFLYTLQFVTREKHYTYLVLTCGSNTGAAGDMFAALMQDNDYALSAYFSVVMPDNYILLYNPVEPEKVGKILERADGELAQICRDIEIRMGGNCDRHRGAVPGLLSRAAYPLYKRGRKTKKFYTTEACTGCGHCETVCPCEAIALGEDKKPKWVEDQCVHCMACIHRCPQTAIQYGRKTLSRRRYYLSEK